MQDEHPHTADLVADAPEQRRHHREAMGPSDHRAAQLAALDLLDECLADLERDRSVRHRLAVVRRLVQGL
jgi:hypothetical protein